MDFAIRERAQQHTGPILPMEQVHTGDIRMEVPFTEGTPTVQATAQAAEDFLGEEEEDVLLVAVAAAAGGGKKNRSVL